MQNESHDMALLERAANQLGEHFDTVQIFVTRHSPVEEGGTINADWGTGNWFARYGQIHDWLLRKDEQARLKARRDDQEDEP